MAAYLDTVGFLPAPVGSPSASAADLLEQSAFAYAVSTSVVVIEAHQLQVACTLHGGHKANITAVKWCPASLNRDSSFPGHLRLASGDSDGNVVVWDVLSAAPIARLEDLPPAREVMRDYALRSASLETSNSTGSSSGTAGLAAGGSSAPSAGGITSLAWVMPGSNVLAVVVAPALLLLWEVTTGSLLWRRELGSGSELFGQLALDPLDSRQLCLCGSSGALAVLQLRDPAADRVDVRQYRINLQPTGVKSPASGAGGNSSSSMPGVQALFTVSRGLLLLLLPRELLLFDLQLGAPAASSALPAGRSPFSHLLGVFGGGVCQGGGDEGGTDYAFCLHADGGLSVWVRVPGELRFKLGSSSSLMPAPLRGAGSQASVVMIRAALWRQHLADDGSQTATSAQTAESTAAITRQISSSLSQLGQQTSTTTPRAAAAAGAAASGGPSTTLSGDCLLVVAVSAGGRVWQWQAALPRYPRRSFLSLSEERPINLLSNASKGAATPATVLPQLVGLLSGLPSGVTSISLQTRPLLLPAYASWLPGAAASSRTPGRHDGAAPGGHEPASNGRGPAECVALGCAGTASGHLMVFLLRRGLVNPLAAEVVGSAALLRDSIRGVRWLGCSPLVVAFGSEKSSSSGGWRNSCAVFDTRTGRSLPFRDTVTSEASPLVGVRASPSGAYLLLLFKGAPAELWTTRPLGGGSASASAGPAEQPVLSKPWRVRLVDLNFTAVEWMETEDELQKGCFSTWARTAPGGHASGGGDAAPAAAPAAAVHSARDSLAGPSFTLDRQLSLWASRTLSLSMGRRTAAGPASGGGADDELPGETLAFALVDGRSGVLSVKGRKVSDLRPARPSSGPGPADILATALAGVWPLLLLGDADGQLLAWDLTTGRCSSLATGQGMVRRIQLAPGAPPALTGTVEAALTGSAAAAAGGAGSSSGVERMRAAVLFAGGAFAVYELDAAGRLRSSPVSPNMSARVGRARDIGWVALPGAAGSGSVLSVVSEDGSLSLVDVAQPAARRPGFRARQQLLRQVLSKPSASLPGRPGDGNSSSSSSSSIPLVLLGPRPLDSSTLLPQPWVLLLRFLLQAGVSQHALLYLSSSSSSPDEDNEVQEELLQLLPSSARSMLAHIAAAAAAAGGRLQQVQSADASSGLRSTGSAAAGAAAAAGRTGSLGSGDIGHLTKTHSSPVLPKSRLGAVAAAGAAPTSSSSARSLLGAGQLQRLPSLPSGSNLLGFDFDEGFDGDLVKVLRRIARLRGRGHLLHADEWQAYTQALSSGQVAGRMAVAAHLSGQQEECRFWGALPPTLANVKALHAAIQAAQHEQQQQVKATAGSGGQQAAAAGAAGALSEPKQRDGAATAATAQQESPPDLPSGGDAAEDAEALPPDVSDYDRMVQQALQAPAAAVGDAAGAAGTPGSLLPRRGSLVAVPGHVRCTGPEHFSERGAIKQAAAGRPVRLWDEELVLAEAQERLLWHEALPPRLWHEAQEMLELRLLQYVALGDFATAVAFLLSTPPENTVSYYRSVVSAMALSATASLQAQSQGSAGSTSRSATLHLQAAKVVSAHAASIDDQLLGVPLNCSAGLNADAVTLLQEAGLWQLAASLVARTLSGTERAQALSRWASHVLHSEGSVWRCVGLLTSAGCLSAAAQVLRSVGLPDCAQAFVVACEQAGLLVPAAKGAGPQAARAASDGGGGAEGGNAAAGPGHGQRLELFDLLGQRTRMMPAYSSGAEPAASGADELALIATEHSTFLCSLLASL